MKDTGTPRRHRALGTQGLARRRILRASRLQCRHHWYSGHGVDQKPAGSLRGTVPCGWHYGCPRVNDRTQRSLNQARVYVPTWYTTPSSLSSMHLPPPTLPAPPLPQGKPSLPLRPSVSSCQPPSPQRCSLQEGTVGLCVAPEPSVCEEMNEQGLPGDPVIKNPPCNAGDSSSIPSSGRSHLPQGN